MGELRHVGKIGQVKSQTHHWREVDSPKVFPSLVLCGRRETFPPAWDTLQVPRTVTGARLLPVPSSQPLSSSQCGPVFGNVCKGSHPTYSLHTRARMHTHAHGCGDQRQSQRQREKETEIEVEVGISLVGG